MGDLKKRLLKEETEGTLAWKPEETGWSVKPGQILVRSVMEPPSAWCWEFIPERILFKRSELRTEEGSARADCPTSLGL